MRAFSASPFINVPHAPRELAAVAQEPRARTHEPGDGSVLLWTLLLSLLAVLSLAFVLLISHQVRKAEARRVSAQVHLTAFEDCLQFVQGSTIASCTRLLGRQTPAPSSPVGGDMPQPSEPGQRSVAVR